MRRQSDVFPLNCNPLPYSCPAKTSWMRKLTVSSSPLPVATAPVIRTCALIAFQSAYSTGAFRLEILPIWARSSNARNNPVRIKSMLRTETISPESSIAPLSCAINRGAAKGMGSITPSVISIRKGCATAPAPINNARISVKIRNIIFSSFHWDQI